MYDYSDGYDNPAEGKTYISRPIENKYGDNSYTIRIVTRGIDSKETYECVKIKDEVVLRLTDGKKNIITAKVLEDSRHIHVLNIQEFGYATGNPHRNGFAFIGDEITKLFNFIKDVQIMRFGSDRFQRLSDEDINYLELTDNQAIQIFRKNPELFENVFRDEITTADIIAVGYRRKQLDVFCRLLTDDVYFDEIKSCKKCKNENLWQKFFEKNQWIFGYGLGYIFLSGLDDKKLEQYVQGYSITSHGKRVDALMKTKGAISNLCFVEIKTHKTKLLSDKPYRSGCWSASEELSGAISQVQGSVSQAIDTLTHEININDEQGNPTGEQIFNYQPKAFLVIGSLTEFETENGINQDKLRSFELYRKNIVSPEIITFDELYERASFIAVFNESKNKLDEANI